VNDALQIFDCHNMAKIPLPAELSPANMTVGRAAVFRGESKPGLRADEQPKSARIGTSTAGSSSLMGNSRRFTLNWTEVFANTQEPNKAIRSRAAMPAGDAGRRLGINTIGKAVKTLVCEPVKPVR
jgi:hypothetical protein